MTEGTTSWQRARAQHLAAEGPVLDLGHSRSLPEKGLARCGNVPPPSKQRVGRGGDVHPYRLKEVRVSVCAGARTGCEGFETQAMQRSFCILNFARMQKLTGAPVNLCIARPEILTGRCL